MRNTKPTATREPSAAVAVVVNLRGSQEYATWVAELADSVGLSVSATADLAVREFAKARGFRQPPKRTAPVGRPRAS